MAFAETMQAKPDEVTLHLEQIPIVGSLNGSMSYAQWLENLENLKSMRYEPKHTLVAATQFLIAGVNSSPITMYRGRPFHVLSSTNL